MLIANTLKGKSKSQQLTNTLWLVTTIKATLKIPIQKLEKPIFSFKRTHESAVRNSKILAALKGVSGAAIAAQNDIPVTYGSKFRDISPLEKVFFYHEDKNKIINIIQQGSCYHIDQIEEETRK